MGEVDERTGPTRATYQASLLRIQNSPLRGWYPGYDGLVEIPELHDKSGDAPACLSSVVSRPDDLAGASPEDALCGLGRKPFKHRGR